MTALLLGLCGLLGLQYLFAAAPLKRALDARFGAASVIICVAALAIAALALVLYGRGNVPYQFVWLPPPWTQALVLPLIFCACMLLGANFVKTNIRRLTATPAAWGIALVAVAHLLLASALGAIVLFAGIALVAVNHAWLFGRFNNRSRPARQAWAQESLTIAVGGGMFFLLFYLHAPLFGISPLLGGRGIG